MADNINKWQEKLIACKNDIEDTIQKAYDGSRLNINFDELVDTHGYDLINQVFAATIMESIHDGRIRRDLKEWADNIPMPEQYDKGQYYYFNLDSHPGLVDIAANKFVNIQKELAKAENLNTEGETDMTLTELIKSQQKLIDCKNDIVKDINKPREDSRQNINFDELVSKYGYDRISQVFAATIMALETDGRID